MGAAGWSAFRLMERRMQESAAALVVELCSMGRPVAEVRRRTEQVRTPLIGDGETE